MDEKTVLLDTVDKSVSGQFFENLEHVLGGRKLDYLIVNHMEPDHGATIAEVAMRYPEVKIVGNAKTFTMMKQFFDFDVDAHAAVSYTHREWLRRKENFGITSFPLWRSDGSGFTGISWDFWHL